MVFPFTCPANFRWTLQEMQIQHVYKTVLEQITLAMQSVFSSAVVRNKTRHLGDVILAMFDDLQGKDKLIETTN